MWAAYVDRLGPAENIRYGRLPDPTPATGELLVRVLATAVNPVDTYVRAGSYRTAVPVPFVVGRDVVGEVLAAGPGVGAFDVGERVWSNSLGYDGRQGAAATLAIVPVDRAVRLPRSVDPVPAAAASHPGSTAATGLLHHARLAAGETLLVFGANGSVGSAAVQVGRECGARVVAVVRRPEAAPAGRVRTSPWTAAATMSPRRCDGWHPVGRTWSGTPRAISRWPPRSRWRRCAVGCC